MSSFPISGIMSRRCVITVRIGGLDGPIFQMYSVIKCSHSGSEGEVKPDLSIYM